MTAAEKISKAKIALLLQPETAFFASILMSTEVKEDETIQLAATDGDVIKLNPQYIEKCELEQVKGLLCSCVLKLANMHALRSAGRDLEQWSQASDYSINPLVINSGLYLPDESLMDKRFENLSAEQIFSLLPAKLPGEKQNDASQKAPQGQQQGPGPGQGQGQGKGKKQKPEPGEAPAAVQIQPSTAKTKTELDQKASDMKMKVSQAELIGRKKNAGKLPGGLEEMINTILEPQINWKEVIARFVCDLARNDYSYKLPNPRFISSGFFMPSLRNEEPGRLVFIIDTSGSMNKELFQRIAGEMQDVANEIKITITVIYVDTKVQGVQEIEPDEKIELKAKGRGGTDFAPGFEYITEHGIDPKAAIYLTDGYCSSYPDEIPDFPVLWIVYNNKHFTPPFGEVLPIEN